MLPFIFYRLLKRTPNPPNPLLQDQHRRNRLSVSGAKLQADDLKLLQTAFDSSLNISTSLQDLESEDELTNDILSNVEHQLIPFSVFPSKAFSIIMSHLNTADQRKLLIVCSSWSLSAAEYLYKELVFNGAKSFSKFTMLLNNVSSYHEYCLFVESIIISTDDCEVGDLDVALHHCENLQSFRLTNCQHISNFLIESLSDHSTQLKRLALPGCTPITLKYIPQLVESCQLLTHLDLSRTRVGIDILPFLFRDCEGLVDLNLSDIEFDKSVTVPVDNLPIHYKLERLCLNNTPTTDYIFKKIAASAPKLHDISLQKTLVSDDSFFSNLGLLQCVTRLNLSLTNITDLTIKTLGMNNKLKFVHGEFAGCGRISEPAIQALIVECINLEFVLLDACKRVVHGELKKFSVQVLEDEQENYDGIIDGISFTDLMSIEGVKEEEIDFKCALTRKGIEKYRGSL